LKISIRKEAIAGKPLLIIEGRLDTAAVPVLDAKIEEELGEGHAKILLDFTNVGYLSSSGMRLLLSLSKKLKEQGGELLLFSIKEEVMEIIKLAGFEKILSIYHDRKAAVAAV